MLYSITPELFASVDHTEHSTAQSIDHIGPVFREVTRHKAVFGMHHFIEFRNISEEIL